MFPLISVVLPCRNEKETLGACIRELRAVAEKNNLVIEIIVSDSSEDGSEVIAKKEEVVLVEHGTEGYGFAVKEGVRHAKGDIIIYADADGTYRFSELPEFLKKLKEADVVIGSRFKGYIEKGAMPLSHRFFGTPFFNALLMIFFGIRISDSQSGYRAMKKQTFFDLNLKTNGMELATEMIIKAKRSHAIIKEVPIRYLRRKGISKLRRYRDGFAHLKYILLQTPFAFYSAAGSLFFAVGIFSLILLNFSSLPVPGVLDSATVKILFPLIGFQLLFFGLFAKTYLSVRFEEKSELMEKFYSIFKLRIAIGVGAVLILVPLFLKVAGISQEIFEPLLVSTILGLQIIFNSIVLSTLSIK